MKKTYRLLIAAIALTIVATALVPSVANAQKRGVLREILRRMDKNARKLKSLRADVRMDKFNLQLRETDVITGSAIYLAKKKKRPVLTRIDWRKPVAESFVLSGDNFDLYRPRLRAHYVGTVSGMKSKHNGPKNPFDFLTMSKKQIRDSFIVSYISQDTIAGTATWRLELEPKEKAAYQSAEMWIDSNGMSLQIKIIDRNEDTTTVLLSNVKKNAKVKAADFKLNIPKGVRIIRG